MTPRRPLFNADNYPGYVLHAGVAHASDCTAPPPMCWITFRLQRQREVTLAPRDLLKCYVDVPAGLLRSHISGQATVNTPTWWALDVLMELIA